MYSKKSVLYAFVVFSFFALIIGSGAAIARNSPKNCTFNTETARTSCNHLELPEGCRWVGSQEWDHELSVKGNHQGFGKLGITFKDEFNQISFAPLIINTPEATIMFPTHLAPIDCSSLDM
jgi:hypothetical protein